MNEALKQFLRVWGDPGIDRVREFHEAFSCVINDSPWMPELDESDRAIMGGYAAILEDLAVALKAAAASANNRRRAALGLVLVRLQLHVEEAGAEYARACADEDLVGVLDALSDASYVVSGTYLTHGLGGVKVAADEEVHRSNLSKLGEDGRPIISDAGRVVKGPRWSPPDLRTVLEKGS
jgi:predicted HAD superfamily Cof-like phosphohydrolase